MRVKTQEPTFLGVGGVHVGLFCVHDCYAVWSEGRGEIRAKPAPYPKQIRVPLLGAIMGMVFETKGKQKADVHYVNGPVPCTIEENFEGNYPDNGGFACAEVLRDQGSVNQSLERTPQIDRAKTSMNYSGPNHGVGQNRKEENSSMNVDSQLAIDEALARELQEQEFGDQLAGTSLIYITERESGPSNKNGEPNSANSSAQVSRQDDIDPDGMTYEELQSLGEAIGTEGKGLSAELISYLPTTTYKTGFFSRKDKHEECVICCMAYKNRDKLIILPCQHQYHSSCVTRWLKINKECPVCKDEVFGS